MPPAKVFVPVPPPVVWPLVVTSLEVRPYAGVVLPFTFGRSVSQPPFSRLITIVPVQVL